MDKPNHKTVLVKEKIRTILYISQKLLDKTLTVDIEINVLLNINKVTLEGALQLA